MKTVRMMALTFAALGALVAFALQIDPAEKVSELNALRNQRMTDARTTGTTIDLNALNAEIAGMARGAVTGVDPATVEARRGLDWARLFSMAEMHREARSAAQRFIDQGSPSPENKLSAQMLILDASNSLRDGPALAALLPDVVKAGDQLAMVSRYLPTYLNTIAATLNPGEALRVLDTVEPMVNLDALPAQQREGVKGNLALVRFNMLERAGRLAEGMAVLERAIADLGPESAMTGRLQSTLTQKQLIGKPAPEFSVINQYGEFTSLADLRGKVVILSFFAHW